MDVVVWLHSLGLGKYEAAFRENEIDETVLQGLTAEDLKELGIAALGHRRKLLDAIAALGTSAGGKAPSDNVETASTAPSAPPEDRAERRQVTVMFSDLVGSTALSARMDPEDLREIITSYQKSVTETVQRFGGFVAKYMGDGVLIYFGYPQAHEDDAERAVRAGLDLVAAVSALKTHAPLQTRVGIATGLVVVGDLIGSGASQEQAIVGETPNLAARLQSIAEPNSVVIAESTRKLVGNLFELKDLGGRDLKGIAGPVRAWAALRSSPIESRFDALHVGGLTELVGRDEELELLLRRWSKAKSGEGQLVLLSGEPGIGKSRLTFALLERLVGEPHTRLRYFCSPQHTDSTLYPIISQMQRAARFTHDETIEAKLDKLDDLLSRSFTHPQDASLLADMLSLPNDGRYPKFDLLPERQRQKTLEALTAQLEGLSRSTPVLMVFEDVHWIDPTSLETVSRTVERIRTLGVLVIVTYRPEFDPPWIGRPYVTALTLNRLGQREVDAIIGHISGNKSLPASVRQDIVERTDGIPLFVEETTKAVLEAGDAGTEERTIAAVPLPSLAVPASLHASLLARLDRLGSAKEIAQVGAAIGREFSHGLLAAVLHKSEQELSTALERLIASGLLFRQGVPPHASYLFKHALVQDAAYGTLLREPRRELHSRIAEILERKFAETTENQPELVARHCTEAGQIEKAASLWGKAGLRSLERSALVEAVEQLTRALAQISILPPSPEQRREDIKLQAAIITPLIHVKGYAAPETRTAATRARLLIEQAEARAEAPDDPLVKFLALYGFLTINVVAFNGGLLRKLSAEFLTLAEEQHAEAPLMIGHRVVGFCLLFLGDIVESLSHIERTIELYQPAKHRPLATRFGTDVRVHALCYRSWAFWLLGSPDAALLDARRAVEGAREMGLAGTLMNALALTSLTYVFCGEWVVAAEHLDELSGFAEEKGSLYWKAFATWLRGWLLAHAGKASEAFETLTSGIAAWRSTGATLFAPMHLSYSAAVYAQLGRFDDARHSIGEAARAIEASKEMWFAAEATRIAGEVALVSPEPQAMKAEAHFECALAIARQQKAKSWELRASMSLARLWRDQGKVQQARELLAPVYGWFNEGFDTRDLKEAKALLEELAP
jgi:class 3 adenylate cyclase/predicted ATPase